MQRIGTGRESPINIFTKESLKFFSDLPYLASETSSAT